jgi:hypothetical protein
MSKNDDRIISLKKQIETKKKDLAEKKVKFTPETNCVLDLEGTKYNLNVCTDEALIMLLLKLNMYKMSARDLNMPIPEYSGYSIDLWISDIRNKLEVSGVCKELNDLKKMEVKLDKLLSDDKKTELELDEIAAMIQL